MKKHLIFYLLSLIFISVSAADNKSIVKKGNAHPINIASLLVLKQDSATIASTLEYYGYTLQSQSPLKPETLTPETSGSAIFTHPDGSTISFYFPSPLKPDTSKPDTSILHPTIQVHTKTSKTQIEKILSDLDYKKSGNHYETTASKYSKHLTKCTFGPGNVITFTRQKK